MGIHFPAEGGEVPFTIGAAVCALFGLASDAQSLLAVYLQFGSRPGGKYLALQLGHFYDARR